MQRLLATLADFCRSHVVDEKLLIVPSFTIGSQITDALARGGTAVVNLRVETVASLAQRVIDAELSSQRLRVMSRAQSFALVEQACREALSEQSYFGALREQPGLYRAVQRSIQDLRAAGVTAERLHLNSFEDERKAAELREVFRRYERLLRDHRAIDREDAIGRATLKLARDTSHTRSLVAVVQIDDLSSKARELVELVALGEPLLIDSEDASWPPANARIRFFSATSELTEVREVFRRIVENSLPADSVEIVLTSSDPYLATIAAVCAEQNIEATFAEGLPVSVSLPGRFAAAYLRWVTSDFEAVELARAIEERLVIVDGDPFRISRALRRLNIGWGRERYVKCIGAAIAREEDEKRRTRLQLALTLSKKLLAISPFNGGTVRLQDLARATSKAVGTFARVVGNFDAAAKNAITKLLDELAEVTKTELDSGSAAARLLESIENAFVESSSPLPGAIHVSSYRTGGYSNRENAFLLGLDEARFPGAGLEDPVLLDSERTRLNKRIDPARLPILGSRPQESLAALTSFVARAGTNLTVSFATRTIGGREGFPAAAMLDLFRKARNNPAATFDDLFRETDAAKAAWAASAPDRAITADEWWLSRALTEERTSLRSEVRAIHPSVAAGDHAVDERNSSRFTAYDGRIEVAPDELDPRASGAEISPSKIEMLARCPHLFFFESILRVRPLEELKRSDPQWLNAAKFGTLFHDVAESFMRAILGQHEKPSYAKHFELLRQIATTELAALRDEIPVAREESFDARRRQLEAMCEIFLKIEEKRCEGLQPKYFELAFGTSAGSKGGSKDDASFASPAEIHLRDGRSFRLTGRLDRVDQRDDGSYEIYDYKTGSANKFKDAKPFNSGRIVQFALYARALETLLRDEGGRVAVSGYLMPNATGSREPVVPDRDEPALDALLSALFELLRTGAFVQTNKDDDCRYCNFTDACGGASEVVARVKRKLEGEDADVLAPFAEARRQK